MVGVMTALLVAIKTLFQSIPNFELVTLFIILFTLFYGPKTLIAVWAFVGVQIVLWGFGIWNIMYIYIWPLLVAVTLIFRKSKHDYVFILIAGIFGLVFGSLCTIPYFFIGGWQTAIAWWVAGIPYDLFHGACNLISAIVLFKPLRKAMNRLGNTIWS